MFDLGIVEPSIVEAIDTWLLANYRDLPEYDVHSPQNRVHSLMLPSDAGGAAAEAVAAVVRNVDILQGGVLVELGSFMVFKGAKAQHVHQDRCVSTTVSLIQRVISIICYYARWKPGFISCQLALHDTQADSGGLAVWPGTHVQKSRPQYPLRQCGEPKCLTKGNTGVQVAPVRAGTVTCYNGNTLHGGLAHTSGSDIRRVFYFTAQTQLHALGRFLTVLSTEPYALRYTPLPVILHPSLLCTPLKNPPLLDLSIFNTKVQGVNVSLQPQSWWLDAMCSWKTRQPADITVRSAVRSDVSWWQKLKENLVPVHGELLKWAPFT